MVCYERLFERVGMPPGAAWGLSVGQDRLGTVARIGQEQIRNAVASVTRGKVFNLDYPINHFEPYPAGKRRSARHEIFSTGPSHRDDYVDSFYMQSTSQIDGLRHFRHPEFGFYAGVRDEEVTAGSAALGIQNYAENGIVGRGVLLDVGRFLAETGEPLALDTNQSISVETLDATAAWAGVGFEDGDILLVRTGWADWYDREGRKGRSGARSPGLEQSRDMLRWLWDRGFALVAADNLALEAYPPHPNSSFRWDQQDDGPPSGSPDPHDGLMHREMIPLLGLAIGEMWALEELAADCHDDGPASFLVMCKPLNLVGGVGSPANALAIRCPVESLSEWSGSDARVVMTNARLLGEPGSGSGSRWNPPSESRRPSADDRRPGTAAPDRAVPTHGAREDTLRPPTARPTRE